MQSLSVLQLQKMLIAFCSHIITQKRKINSINVFPVPDQDTGSNLAATLEKVKNELEKAEIGSIQALSDVVEKTALYSAQGNSGIIFAGFLSGFFGKLRSGKDEIDPALLFRSFQEGTQKAYLSIESPKQGTILDVMDAVVETMRRLSLKADCTIERMLEESFSASTKALAKTQEQMAVLRESKVVDAGGLAFVMMLESFCESLTGKPLEIKEEKKQAQLTKGNALITKNKIEVVCIVKDSLVDSNGIKEMLKDLGDSLDILEISDSIKLHIHTDQPQTVKEVVTSLGELQFLQIMDMKEEKMLELIDTVK